MRVKQEVRLAHIAEEVGLDKSTVSLALRCDQRIKPATRQRVMEASSRLGYRPDPHLSQLMGYLRATGEKSAESCIAYLKLYPPGPNGLDQKPFYKGFEEGAKSEIEKLGYRVEDFRASAYKGKAKRIYLRSGRKKFPGMIPDKD